MKRLVMALLATGLLAQHGPTHCSQCAVWNVPQEPFQIYGNTYYVGTHGLASILIVSPTGHVLIDGDLAESAALIAGNIKTLGFRLQDVKLIVNSHAHYDHAGGISELQRESGARVAASRWTAAVMKRGAVAHDDPQLGIITPIEPVANVETLRDGETLHAGGVSVTAHLTGGHTPGGTSWTWQSCQNGRCLNMVYADSLTPVSAPGFLFSRGRPYSHAIEDFKSSYGFLESTPCDILLTPHPDVSNLWQRLEKRKSDPNAFVDPAACRVLAATARQQLAKRLAEERSSGKR